MSTLAPTPSAHALESSWVYKNLAIRRDLPLALLTLWGCLLLMGQAIHPIHSSNSVYRSSIPISRAEGYGIDYYQFWVVCRARELKLNDIYSDVDRRRMAQWGTEISRSNNPPSERLDECSRIRQPIIETFSTPFLYAAMSLLVSCDYDRDFDDFMNVCLAGLIFSVVALGWMLRFTMVEIVLLGAVVVLWSFPLTSDLRVGNVNQLQLAGLSLYLLVRRASEGLSTNVCAGLVLGFLVAFKPTLVVIPIFLTFGLIIDRRWRTLITQGTALGVSVSAAFVVGCLYLRSWSAWMDWYNAVSRLEDVSIISVEMGNFSLSQLVLEATKDAQNRGGMRIAPFLLIGTLLLGCIALWMTRPCDPSMGGIFVRA